MTRPASADSGVAATRSWRFEGRVQGVGFRPHVWRLAQELELVGEVLNEGDSACVVARAGTATLDMFLQRLHRELPERAALSRVTELPTSDRGFDDFRIVDSVETESVARFPLDTRTCQSCRTEVKNPADRRYGYVFTNCMDCGPRYSIIQSLPYDRVDTSMVDFPMCDDCLSEYNDPANRRFHAQPIACPACGPKLTFLDSDCRVAEGDALETAVTKLGEGKIIAIKGLGGFHIACDATNMAAVASLRERKRRPTKPFAVMVADLHQANDLCEVEGAAAAELSCPENPIVLVARRGNGVCEDVAPDQHRLGLLLPTTPLHQRLVEALGRPLVMTSGNLSGQPQCIDNDVALSELQTLVDGFLMHDRPIVNRLDDSVVHVGQQGRSVLRRARGLAPALIDWPPGFEPQIGAIAVGAHLKNTCAIATGEGVLVSPHIGDLESARAQQEAAQTLRLLLESTGLTVSHVVVDCHPDYASTQAGILIAEENELVAERVQHHHAHMAACLFEHGVSIHAPPALGLVLDGMGLAEDGGIWGGEWLLGGYASVKRVAHLQPRPLLGGAVAMREPWRNLLALLCYPEDQRQSVQLWSSVDALAAPMQRFSPSSLEALLNRAEFSPMASSGGRLIDALAAIVLPTIAKQHFEGECGMALESLALSSKNRGSGYAVPVDALNASGGVDLSVLARMALDDQQAGAAPADVAWRILSGLATALANKTVALASSHAISKVVLSGGLFQNPTLTSLVAKTLEAANLQVLRHQQCSANDENISLGQMAVSTARRGVN